LDKKIIMNMHFFISLILLAVWWSVTASSENSVCYVQRLLRIRHAESNRAMQWSSGFFSGHALRAVAVDPSESRQIWAGERRKDYYWRLLSDERVGEDATKYCLQAPDYAMRGGTLRMEPCNDDIKAQAWMFKKDEYMDPNEYTITNFDLEACLTVRADGSYSFLDCDEAADASIFSVDEVDVHV
jgi:hypothetical protein